jgi:hypothetical protein
VLKANLFAAQRAVQARASAQREGVAWNRWLGIKSTCSLDRPRGGRGRRSALAASALEPSPDWQRAPISRRTRRARSTSMEAEYSRVGRLAYPKNLGFLPARSILKVSWTAAGGLPWT